MSLSNPFSGAITGTGARKAQGNGIYVWEAGDLEFKTTDGTVVGPYPVVAGQMVPFRCTELLSGTTATVSVGTH